MPIKDYGFWLNNYFMPKHSQHDHEGPAFALKKQLKEDILRILEQERFRQSNKKTLKKSVISFAQRKTRIADITFAYNNS